MEASPDLEGFRRIRPLTDADGECADDAGEGSPRGDNAFVSASADARPSRTS